MGRNPEVKGGPSDPVWFTGQENLLRVVGSSGLADESGALVTIPWIHSLVHRGLLFQADTYVAALANAGTLILATPDPIGYEAHFTLSAQCGGDATVELIEGSTPTGGVAKQARNLNRNFVDGDNMLVDPALAGGVVIGGPQLLPGGRGPQAGGGSMGTRADLEWETQDDEQYAIRLTNVSGNTQPASIIVNFYVI